MKYIHILTELWATPTLLMPKMHKQICDIVQAHMEGRVRELSPEEKREEAKMTFVEDIAIIPVHGIIARGVSTVEGSSGVSDVFNTNKMIDIAVEDENIAGIMFEFDSPGGSLVGTPELAEKIFAIGKPTAAFTDTLMASCAYFLASQTDIIIASKSSTVGAIGVYMAWLDLSRQFEMLGVKAEIIKQGKFKGMGLPGTSLSDEDRALLQAKVDTAAGWFKEAVGRKRNVPDSAMQGQGFYAEDALAVDMIDKVGDQETAINELRGLIAQQETRI